MKPLKYADGSAVTMFGLPVYESEAVAPGGALLLGPPLTSEAWQRLLYPGVELSQEINGTRFAVVLFKGGKGDAGPT